MLENEKFFSYPLPATRKLLCIVEKLVRTGRVFKSSELAVLSDKFVIGPFVARWRTGRVPTVALATHHMSPSTLYLTRHAVPATTHRSRAGKSRMGDQVLQPRA